MNSYKRRSVHMHYLLCFIVTVATFSFPCTGFSADLNKVKEFLLVSDMARMWDKVMLQEALKSYTDALVKSERFTREQLDQETIKMQLTYKKHLSYHLVEPDLEQCLMVSLQNPDVDFLIKYDLGLIQEAPDHESKFQKTLEEVQVCVRSIMRIKLRKLKDAGEL